VKIDNFEGNWCNPSSYLASILQRAGIYAPFFGKNARWKKQQHPMKSLDCSPRLGMLGAPIGLPHCSRVMRISSTWWAFGGTAALRGKDRRGAAGAHRGSVSLAVGMAHIFNNIPFMDEMMAYWYNFAIMFEAVVVG